MYGIKGKYNCIMASGTFIILNINIIWYFPFNMVWNLKIYFSSFSKVDAYPKYIDSLFHKVKLNTDYFIFTL